MTAANAVTPLQTVVTANPAAVTSNTLTRTATGGNATGSTSGTVNATNVDLRQFDTTSGILVGATVAVNTAVANTVQVIGVVPPNGGGRTVNATSLLNGTITGAGVSFSSGNVTASRQCSGGNCANSPGNSQTITTGSISGSAAVSAANLSAYAGASTVALTRTATGSVSVQNGANATSGTGNGIFTFGSATPASNVYSITYDYLNFSNPSFDGVIIVESKTLDFGTLFQNSGPVTLNFSLHNIGNVNSAGISLTSIARQNNSSDFTTSASTFVNGLDGGTSINYSVMFNPTTVGAAAELFTLALADFAPNSFGGKLHQLQLFAKANVVTAPQGIPEPGTWALMIVGFAFVGVSKRRQIERITA